MGEERWPPDTTERHEAIEELTAAVRRLVEATVTTGLPSADLRRLAGDAEALAERLEAVRDDEPWQSRCHGAGIAEPSHLMAVTPAIGCSNPAAPVADLRVGEDRSVQGTVRFTTTHLGPPGRAHGGMVASVLDQVLGLASIAAGSPGMTSTMTVRYRRATPVHADLHIEARCAPGEGGVGHATGSITDPDGRVTAEAEASFVLPKNYRP